MVSQYTHEYLFENLVDDCHAALLEFVGTTMFLLLGFGGIQAAAAEAQVDATALGGTSSVQRVLYVATSMGFSLLVSAWLFFRVTGSLFNPNVSLALLLCGIIRPVRFVLYCIAQLVGAIAASAIVRGLTSAPLAVNTTLSAQTNLAQGVFIEMFITTALVLSVLMLAAEKHPTTPFAPIGVGLTLFTGHLFAVYYTGAGMNTARSFGPAVVSGFPDGHHWVYWIGPFLGSLLGSAFYSTLKHYRYWILNPHQDTPDSSKSPTDPVVKARSVFSERTFMPDGPRASVGDGVAPRKMSVGSHSDKHAATSNTTHEREKVNGSMV
ncbi:hypothetical protein HGRIS_000949 [Hohenbuehelia grisea]|uniref:Aquaporin-like protein n=1 Tax=Hohenbuehelia grisea TaxID=104357 RepID=A0ABR3IQ92_9AGAR